MTRAPTAGPAETEPGAQDGRTGRFPPEYHMNKRHWNTVELDGSVEPDELFGMLEDSYELVLATLPKQERARSCDS
ncbi:MAG TPA: MmcQ/YjbR family DNA-binding protein [Kineosporiaceae bacterium]